MPGESNTGRAERAQNEHLVYHVLNSGGGIAMQTQRKQTAIDEANRFRDEFRQTYTVQESRLFSGEASKIVHRAEFKA